MRRRPHRRPRHRPQILFATSSLPTVLRSQGARSRVGSDVYVAVSRLITSLQRIDSAPVSGRVEGKVPVRCGRALVDDLSRLATAPPTSVSLLRVTDRNDPGRCAGSRDVAVDVQGGVKVKVQVPFEAPSRDVNALAVGDREQDGVGRRDRDQDWQSLPPHIPRAVGAGAGGDSAGAAPTPIRAAAHGESRARALLRATLRRPRSAIVAAWISSWCVRVAERALPTGSTCARSSRAGTCWTARAGDATRWSTACRS